MKLDHLRVPPAQIKFTLISTQLFTSIWSTRENLLESLHPQIYSKAEIIEAEMHYSWHILLTWIMFLYMYGVMSSSWVSNVKTEYCAMQPNDCKTVGIFCPLCRDSTSLWRDRQKSSQIIVSNKHILWACKISKIQTHKNRKTFWHFPYKTKLEWC